jgi:RNAse (barnase) inhibitor barstar
MYASELAALWDVCFRTGSIMGCMLQNWQHYGMYASELAALWDVCFRTIPHTRSIKMNLDFSSIRELSE